MPDPQSTEGDSSRFWRSLRNLILGRNGDQTLREEIEEAIEEHAGDLPSPDDLSSVERTMLSNLLELGERPVDDVAVPRSDIIAFPEDGRFAALVAQFAEAGHSRMPLFRDNLDNVVGMIHIKDVYARIAQTFDDAVSSAPFADLRVADFMRPVLYVPQSMTVLDLLARMRHQRTHMAIVVDEYGGTDGLVTIEDLVEEIVGDIEDEHDEDEPAMLVAAGPGCWDADARLDLAELEEALGRSLAHDDIEEDVDTLGGMIFILAGRVPLEGEVVAHPAGWRFEVTEADERRVLRARVHAPEPAPVEN